MIDRMSSSSSPESRFDGPVPGVPDAAIREVDELPAHLPDGVRIGPCTEAGRGILLFEVPGVARYLIQDGSRIDVAVAANGDRAAAELFLHGSARGTLIHQRGELPLSAVTLMAPNWKCVALAGPSGFGKSTLAAELCGRGWKLVADDITRITWNGSIAVAWPSHDRLKLWRDACAQAGLNVGAARRVRAGLEKFYIPMKAAATPAVLGLVVRLRVASKLDVSHVPFAHYTNLLSENAFRNRQIDPLGVRAAHVQIVSRVSSGSAAVWLDGTRRHPVGELADRIARAAA